MSEEQEVQAPPAPVTGGTPNLNAAVARCLGMIENPTKDKEVTIKSDKGVYKFRYATLSAILDILRPAMSACGLGVSNTLSPDSRWFESTLTHASGEERTVRLPWGLAPSTDIKSVGSAMTYRTRYALAMHFSFAGDDDDDASAETGDVVQDARPTAAQRAQEARPWARKPEPAPTPPAGRDAELRRLYALVKPAKLTGSVQFDGAPRTTAIIPKPMQPSLAATDIEFHLNQDGEGYVLPGDLDPRQVAILRGLYEQHLQTADAAVALGNVPATSNSSPGR